MKRPVSTAFIVLSFVLALTLLVVVVCADVTIQGVPSIALIAPFLLPAVFDPVRRWRPVHAAAPRSPPS